MYFLVTASTKPLDVATLQTFVEGAGPCFVLSQGQGQIIYFLVNISPKPLDTETSNYSGT